MVHGYTALEPSRIKDKTDFSLRYACGMFIVGADLGDAKTGDFEIIRQYMRPIPR